MTHGMCPNFRRWAISVTLCIVAILALQGGLPGRLSDRMFAAAATTNDNTAWNGATTGVSDGGTAAELTITPVNPSERAMLPGDRRPAEVTSPSGSTSSPRNTHSSENVAGTPATAGGRTGSDSGSVRRPITSGGNTATGRGDATGAGGAGSGGGAGATLPSGSAWNGNTGSVATVPTVPMQLPDAMVTKLKQFAIPFNIADSSDPARSPRTVQLLGSTDRGATWYIIGAADASQREFAFRSSGDMEYWFRLRSLNGYGMPMESDNPAPQKRVIVDTVAPELALIAQPYRRPDAAEPQTLVRWRVQDPHFDPAGFRLLVWNVLDASWKVVTFPESCWDGAAPIWDGEVICPFSPVETTTFRAEATDLAGNFISRQVGVSASTGEVNDAIGGGGAAGSLDPSMLYPSERAAAEAERVRRLPGTSTVNSGGWRGTIQTGPNVDRSRVSGADASASQESDDDQVSVEIISAYGTRTPADQGRFRGLPEGVRPQMSSARDFEIGYDVGNVGPSGVARVELWGTRDGGRTWKSFGADPDRASPLHVTLEQEGWYGFIVTVQSGAGVGGTPPESGDPAQIWIGVDRTPPAGRFLDVKYDSGKLTATYEIEEVWLAERPVRFFYASSVDRAWTPIGTDSLDATGLFIWTLDPSVPDRFYLRIEMRDRAGNTGICEWPEEIIADRVRPSAKIRAVQPVGAVRVPDIPNP